MLPLDSYSFAIDVKDFGSIMDTSSSQAKDAVLSRDEQKGLLQTHEALYGSITISFMPLHIRKFSRFTFCGHCIKGSPNSNVIAARWPQNQTSCRIGNISYFFVHQIELVTGNSTVHLQHLLDRVHFFQQHPCANYFNNPDIVVTYNDYDCNMGYCTFLPVQRMTGLCAHGTMLLPFQHSMAEHSVTVSNILPFNFTVL